MSAKRRKPGPNDIVLPLIERVQKFEWKFYNAQTQKWENAWKSENGRPMFAELMFALDDGQISRSVFWIPPILKRQNNGLPTGTPAVGPDGQPLPGAAGGLPPGTPATPGGPGVLPVSR